MTVLWALVLVLVVPAAAARPCATDRECERWHAGQCWTYIGGSSVCACAEDQAYRADLGTCEPSVEPLVSEVVLATRLPYFADNGTADRYGATPVWPQTWSCDAKRCVATDSASLAYYMVRDAGLLGGTVLRPDDVALHCAPGTRFYESAFAPSRYLANAAPRHDQNCISCDSWCGAHGTCTNASSFKCFCDAGWAGRRCEHAVASPMLSALAPAGASAPAVSLAYTANDMFRVLMAAAFPAYSATRPCVSDGSCSGNERCYVSVVSAAAFGVGGSSVCFCAPGFVPTAGATVGCSAAETRPVFGARVGGRNSLGLVTNNFTADGLQLALLTLANGASVVSARASDFTPQSRSSARMDPVLIACSVLSVKDPLNPAGWCDACAVGCNGQSCTTTEGCVCDAAHTGAQCTECVDGSMLAPACNVSQADCATSRCNGNGACVADTCICDANHVGPSCGETPVSCGHLYCNDRGLCAADGTCVCHGGWTGVNCTVSAEDCAARLCDGQGACAGTSCSCATNRTGASCATPLCLGGTAVGGQCVCDAGRSGTWCEIAPCGGNGTLQNDGTCLCEGVLRGPTCTEHICGDGYAYDPYTCVCPPDYNLIYTALPRCIPPLRTATATAAFLRARPSTTERALVAALISAAPVAVVLVKWLWPRKRTRPDG